MIKFTLADSMELTPMNLKLLKLKKQYPYIFKQDVEIESFYGCPPNCIWNGGSVYIENWDKTSAIIPVQEYNKQGISYRFTFTNSLLNEKHLQDGFGNYILMSCENSLNGVLCSTDLMKNYIQKNYPKYQIINSITRCEYGLDEINKLSKTDVTVLPIRFNNKWSKLIQLEHPENIEILCNETCVENCPYNKIHYEKMSLKQLGIFNNDFKCPYTMNVSINGNKRSHTINPNDVEKYSKLGINRFKLSGRIMGIF